MLNAFCHRVIPVWQKQISKWRPMQTCGAVPRQIGAVQGKRNGACRRLIQRRFFLEKPTRAKLSKVRGYAVPKNNARVMAIQMWAVVQWSGHVTCIFDKCHISSKHAVRGYVSKAELTWDLDVENGYFVSVETRWPRSSSGEYKVKQQMKSMIYVAGFPLMPMETRGIFTFLKPVFMLALCWNVFVQRQMSISGAINPALYIW